jgi:hypothetical protein
VSAEMRGEEEMGEMVETSETVDRGVCRHGRGRDGGNGQGRGGGENAALKEGR